MTGMALEKLFKDAPTPLPLTSPVFHLMIARDKKRPKLSTTSTRGDTKPTLNKGEACARCEQTRRT